MNKIVSKKLEFLVTNFNDLSISRTAEDFLYPVVNDKPLSDWKKDKQALEAVNLVWQCAAGLLKGEVASCKFLPVG